MLLFLIIFGVLLFILFKHFYQSKEGFNEYPIFMENVNNIIFDVTTPYPSDIFYKNIIPPLQNFCNVYGSSDSKCNKLTTDNCKASSCCVLLNNTSSSFKCVGGSVQGSTFKSDADSYYYMNKLYKISTPKMIS